MWRKAFCKTSHVKLYTLPACPAVHLHLSFQNRPENVFMSPKHLGLCGVNTMRQQRSWWVWRWRSHVATSSPDVFLFSGVHMGVRHAFPWSQSARRISVESPSSCRFASMFGQMLLKRGDAMFGSRTLKLLSETGPCSTDRPRAPTCTPGTHTLWWKGGGV